MKKLIIIAIALIGLTSCNRPEANYEGVLMTEYGRNGIKSFQTVTGAQGMLLWGEELYQVPMWEQNGDPAKVDILTMDGSAFTVDPSYTYNPTRLHGPNIVLQYKNLDLTDEEAFFDMIEKKILNQRVIDTYRDEAADYKTSDALMTNKKKFEKKVEARLKKEFAFKHFDLNTLSSGLKPQQSMINAIEARNVAIQEANTVNNQLNTARQLQAKALIEARTNDIIAGGLDNKILTVKWINMLKYTKNKVIFTDGRTPVIFNNN